eukprot:scaffold31709_cov41-Cyclotella_meneghiniana.AAC.8
MSISRQQPLHLHRRGSTFGWSVSVTHLAVLTSKVMHMLRQSDVLLMDMGRLDTMKKLTVDGHG